MVSPLGQEACPVAPFCPSNLPKLCPFMAQTWSLHGPPNCRVGKFGDFKKKSKKYISFIKIIFFLFKSDFYIFFEIFHITTENWTNFKRRESLMIIILIVYPYFQLYSLFFFLVDF